MFEPAILRKVSKLLRIELRPVIREQYVRYSKATEHFLQFDCSFRRIDLLRNDADLQVTRIVVNRKQASVSFVQEKLALTLVTKFVEGNLFPSLVRCDLVGTSHR